MDKSVTIIWSGFGTTIVGKEGKLYLHYDAGGIASSPCTKEITEEESNLIQAGTVKDLSTVIASVHKRPLVEKW